MAFTIGRAGPPLFGPVADATSKISSETGPDLEEVETDVRRLLNLKAPCTDLAMARLSHFSRSQEMQGFE